MEYAMIQPLLSDDALADEIDAFADSAALNLWWIGQSGFVVTCNGRRVVLDPYLSDSLTRKYHATKKPHVRMSRHVTNSGKH